jgi:hypothetical protein
MFHDFLQVVIILKFIKQQNLFNLILFEIPFFNRFSTKILNFIVNKKFELLFNEKE